MLRMTHAFCYYSVQGATLRNRHVVLFDARNLSTPLQHRESSLKHQTRCLKCFPDATGYALSSIEGRARGFPASDGCEAPRRARPAPG